MGDSNCRSKVVHTNLCLYFQGSIHHVTHRPQQLRLGLHMKTYHWVIKALGEYAMMMDSLRTVIIYCVRMMNSGNKAISMHSNSSSYVGSCFFFGYCAGFCARLSGHTNKRGIHWRFYTDMSEFLSIFIFNHLREERLLYNIIGRREFHPKEQTLYNCFLFLLKYTFGCVYSSRLNCMGRIRLSTK